MLAIHPGEHLTEELRELNLNATELAYHIAVPPSHITQILNGESPITVEIAMQLARFFGTSDAFWLNLQSMYESRIAGNNEEELS